MNETKIEYKNVGDINPYENNPRKNDEAVKYVAESIKQFGFKVPIVVDKNNVVVAGHTRLKAAKELGLDKVPVIVADDLTEEQIKAFRIADNKTGEQSYWDMDMLGDELKSIVDGFDMTDFGFGDFELTMLLEDMEPEGYDKELEAQYSGREQEYLARERVIINYTEETKPKLLEILGLNDIDKVVYDIEELV